MDREFEQRAILDSMVRNFCIACSTNFVSQKGRAGIWKASLSPQLEYLALYFADKAFGFMNIHRAPSGYISWRWFSSAIKPEWVKCSDPQDEWRQRWLNTKSGVIPDDLFMPMTDDLFKAMQNYLRSAGLPLPPLFRTVR